MRPPIPSFLFACSLLLACSGGGTSVVGPSIPDDAGTLQSDAGTPSTDASSNDAASASACGSYVSGKYLQHAVVLEGDATCETGDFETELSWPIDAEDCELVHDESACTTKRTCTHGIVTTTDVYALPGKAALTTFHVSRTTEAKSLQGGGNSKCVWDVVFTKK